MRLGSMITDDEATALRDEVARLREEADRMMADHTNTLGVLLQLISYCQERGDLADAVVDAALGVAAVPYVTEQAVEKLFYRLKDLERWEQQHPAPALNPDIISLTSQRVATRPTLASQQTRQPSRRTSAA